MKKININGKDYVKVAEIANEIRHLRKEGAATTIGYAAVREMGITQEQCDLITQITMERFTRALFREELAKTEDEDERQAIIEIPGDFIVARRDKDNPKTVCAFREWKDGKAVFSTAPEAMIFSYESKAREIAETLGEGWSVIDISPEEGERCKRLLKAIFDNPDQEDESNG